MKWAIKWLIHSLPRNSSLENVPPTSSASCCDGILVIITEKASFNIWGLKYTRHSTISLRPWGPHRFVFTRGQWWRPTLLPYKTILSTFWDLRCSEDAIKVVEKRKRRKEKRKHTQAAVTCNIHFGDKPKQVYWTLFHHWEPIVHHEAVRRRLISLLLFSINFRRQKFAVWTRRWARRPSCRMTGQQMTILHSIPRLAASPPPPSLPLLPLPHPHTAPPTGRAAITVSADTRMWGPGWRSSHVRLTGFDRQLSSLRVTGTGTGTGHRPGKDGRRLNCHTLLSYPTLSYSTSTTVPSDCYCDC